MKKMQAPTNGFDDKIKILFLWIYNFCWQYSEFQQLFKLFDQKLLVCGLFWNSFAVRVIPAKPNSFAQWTASAADFRKDKENICHVGWGKERNHRKMAEDGGEWKFPDKTCTPWIRWKMGKYFPSSSSLSLRASENIQWNDIHKTLYFQTQHYKFFFNYLQ